jgi:hypothetical protein
VPHENGCEGMTTIAETATLRVPHVSLRIGTWNVEYAYPKRLEELRQHFAQNDADIWVLTETHDDLAPSPDHHPVHSAPRPKNWRGIREGSRWVTIWSRYPIVPCAIQVGDPERSVCALLDLGADQQLLVYGTVLPWKGDRGKFDWSEHHRVILEESALPPQKTLGLGGVRALAEAATFDQLATQVHAALERLKTDKRTTQGSDIQ